MSYMQQLQRSGSVRMKEERIKQVPVSSSIKPVQIKVKREEFDILVVVFRFKQQRFIGPKPEIRRLKY